MDEREFVNSFDCNFPYHDKTAWLNLIEQGRQISSNASFAVLYEICMPPVSADVTSNELREIADHWQEHFSHPLLPIVARAADTLIHDGKLSDEEAIEMMKIVSGYRNEYSALAIVAASCEDPKGAANKVYDEIVSSWSEVPFTNGSTEIE